MEENKNLSAEQADIPPEQPPENSSEVPPITTRPAVDNKSLFQNNLKLKQQKLLIHRKLKKWKYIIHTTSRIKRNGRNICLNS
jgi:hypothetical protein